MSHRERACFVHLEILGGQGDILPMRNFMALVVLLCGAVSAYSDEPKKWCSEDGHQIVQVTTSDYRLDGAPVSGEFRGIEKDGIWGIVYQGRVFWPCP